MFMRLLRFFTLLMTYCLYHTATATTLGQGIFFDPIHGSRLLTYENIHGLAIVEGDILLGKAAKISKASILLPKVGGSLWPEGILPYTFADDLPVMNKMATLQAMSLWQNKTNVKFVEVTPENSAHYPDFISFEPIAGTTCASYVGRQKGRQIVNLSPRCNTMITVHEIGHALGLWHEQSRNDRDLYIRIIWENIEEDHRYNFDQHLTDSRDYGDYDYQSIMHYQPYAFSKNGEKTIVALTEGVILGQRDHISEKDIAAINELYPAETK